MAAKSKDCRCLLYAIREYFCCLGKRTELGGSQINSLVFEIQDIDLAESEGSLPPFPHPFHPEVYMCHIRIGLGILA